MSGACMPRVDQLVEASGKAKTAVRVIELVHGTRDGERLVLDAAEVGAVHVFPNGETYRARHAPDACSTTGEARVWHYDLVREVPA